MNRTLHIQAVLSFLMLLTGLGSARSWAGWITIRNETNQTIIIQETAQCNGILRRSKPIKLVPGEVFREFQSNPGKKQVSVLEEGMLINKLICKGDLDWQHADKSFTVVKSQEKINLMTSEEAAAITKKSVISRAQAPAAVAEKPK